MIDETLGVGDREFRAKAQLRLRSFIERTGTVIISTHSLGLAKELCSRGVVLEKGSILFDGSIEGIRKGKNIFAVQYHPEASPGPHDSHYLFHEFKKMINQNA